MLVVAGAEGMWKSVLSISKVRRKSIALLAVDFLLTVISSALRCLTR